MPKRPVVPKPKRRRVDPLLERPVFPSIPAPTLTFEGLSNADNVTEFGFPVTPPDTNGDVGPNHYVQAVNTLFRVFDKAGGAVAPPATISSLFAAAGSTGWCALLDDGDPIVLYDHLADRWLLSQMALAPRSAGPRMCVAVSETGDPTGAYFVYEFKMPKEPDYSKFGVWPDAYYMTTHQFDPGFAGVGVFAFNRARMLIGDPTANFVYFDLEGVDPAIFGMLPSDLDGLPPPAGTPNYFVYFTSDDFGDPQGDALRVFEFHADFANPLNSTFMERPESPIAVAMFDPNLCGLSRNCIPQPGTIRQLDAISDRLMYRLQYRNFASCPFGSGSCGALAVNHAVDVDGSDHAGIRWYVLRIDHGAGTVSLEQQGTHSPDSDHRWMGSAALDGLGNLAVGFSVSSSLTFPSIRYAGRLAGDPAGTLGQGEATLTGGAGSQTGSNRWGDYTMLTVDPVDDCTFWYTNQYYSMSSATGWQTRIGSFKLASSCPTPASRGTLEGVVTDLLTGLPVQGALVLTSNGFAGTTDAGGHYSLALPPGTYTVTASALDHGPVVVSGIAVAAGATTMQDFALPRPAPDLTGSLVDVTQSCRMRRGVLGCKLGGVLVLTNRGTVNAPGFLVRIYLSEDSTLDGGDTLLKEISFRSLRAGRTQRKSVKATLPDGTSATDKFLIAAIDPDNAILEENETNNTPTFGPIPPPPP